MPVAVVTSDFAMQNVALRMGLQLATTAGKAVSSVKSWVLKCDACFTILPDGQLDRLFCPRCGSNTLARLGVTVGADGAPRYHYKAHRSVPVRGTVFALPQPRGGRSGDLLLREDQLLTGIWAQRAKTAAAAAGRAGDGGGVTYADAGSDAARWASRQAGVQAGGAYALAAPDIQVGFGRRNPNEVRRGGQRR